MIQIVVFVAFFFSIASIIIGFYLALRGYRPAVYFVIAWSFFLIGIAMLSLKNFGLLPSMFLTEYGSQIGATFEVVLLSLALGDKINVLKRDKELAQKEIIETQKNLINSYARFVPEQLLAFLGKNIITEISLGDSIQKDMTILFSDIRSYTSISEGMNPNENFNFINAYMAVMGPCIRKYNGFIDKYIGDAIMALFPLEPSDAIDASIEMLEELHKLNLKIKEKGFKPISIGIGIHTGSQMLGIIGEKERLEGTVISDVVNTASRLEGLTKVYSSSLLVTDEVLGKVNEGKYFYRHLDTVKVKGKNKAVHILEILNGNSKRIIDLKLKTKIHFEKGIELYLDKKFSESLIQFDKVIQEDPKDKAALIYIDRCKFYLKNGVALDWDGIEKLDFK
jgi:adenylate cyclase